MTTLVRAGASTLLIISLVAGAALAGGKKTPKASAVPGQDDYRSATGYTVALMEHCKAVNKLARDKGDFNVELAREHAAEASRNAASLARHTTGYMNALDSERRGQISEQSAVQESSESRIAQLAGALSDALKAPSPDRKAVAQVATDLYLAAKDFLTAHKAAGKLLGIRAATPPRKPSPRKPKAPKDTMAKEGER